MQVTALHTLTHTHTHTTPFKENMTHTDKYAGEWSTHWERSRLSEEECFFLLLRFSSFWILNKTAPLVVLPVKANKHLTHSRKTVVHTNTHRKKNPNRHFLGGKDCKHTPHLKPEKQTCARTFPDTERAIQTYTNKHSLPERTKHINTHTHTLWDYAKSERGTQTLQKFKKHARRRKKAKNTKLHTLRETNTHTSWA